MGNLAKSVDTADSVGIQVMRRASSRQSEREAAPLGIADPLKDLTPIATAAANRIKANRYDRQVGSYLFGDRDGRVFVLSEQSICVGPMLKDSPSSFVGLYAASTRDGKRPKCPSAEQIFEDLRQHFVDVGLVTDAHLYAAVRGVEG